MTLKDVRAVDQNGKPRHVVGGMRIEARWVSLDPNFVDGWGPYVSFTFVQKIQIVGTRDSINDMRYIAGSYASSAVEVNSGTCSVI